MKRIPVTLAAMLILAANIFAQTTWKVDKVHSNVKFSVNHLVVSEVEGTFKNFSGEMRTSRPDFTDAVVAFTVDVNSINTDEEKRDQHLKSEDFFYAEKYPEMKFKSVTWKKQSGKKYILTGDLTIRDVTKRVSFDVTHGGTVLDGRGNSVTGFKATTVINRRDFGLKWGALTEAGGAVVGKNVTITMNLEFVKEKSS